MGILFLGKESPKKETYILLEDEEHAYSPLAFAAEHTKMILGFIIIDSWMLFLIQYFREAFFVSSLLGLVHAAGTKKTKKTHWAREGAVLTKTEHERVTPAPTPHDL